MSDPALYGLLVTGVALFIAEQAGLVAVGYIAARRALREAVAEARELRAERDAAAAIVAGCERRGCIQRTAGRHRGPAEEAGNG